MKSLMLLVFIILKQILNFINIFIRYTKPENDSIFIDSTILRNVQYISFNLQTYSRYSLYFPFSLTITPFHPPFHSLSLSYTILHPFVHPSI